MIHASAGWKIEWLVPPSPLVGANGMRWGPDGGLYVAQALGSQISKIDVAAGTVDLISSCGDGLVAPDDLAFDSRGNLYATEVMSDQVSVRRPDGTRALIATNTPAANGITIHDDRIFMSEFTPGGRILELFADGAEPRTIASGLMMPNALCLAPDGMLYFPLVPLGEIWRVSAEGGTPERVIGGLVMPTAVKVEAAGTLLVTEAATGALVRIDPVARTKHIVANLTYGLDNLAFSPDGRVFVSHFTDGEVIEIDMHRPGSERQVVAGGLIGPYGLCAREDGALVVADGSSLARVDTEGRLTRVAIMIEPGFPGSVRGIAWDGADAFLVTNTAGQLSRYRVGEEAIALLDGLDQAMGAAVDPEGAVYVCEAGAGRVLRVGPDGAISTLAGGLDRPVGVHVLADGSLVVSEAGAGRLLHLKNGDTSVLLAGLVEPHGLAATDGTLFALDAGSQTLHAIKLGGGEAEVIAAGLPVGRATSSKPVSLPGIGAILPGPIVPFSDLALLPGGAIAVGADGCGAIVRITRDLI